MRALVLDEAAALLLGGKLLDSAPDGPSREDFGRALDKVRAVLDGADRDRLASVDADVEVLALGSRFPVDGTGRADDHAGDRWLLQWVDEVEVLRGEAVRGALRDAAVRLAAHWGRASGPEPARPAEPS